MQVRLFKVFLNWFKKVLVPIRMFFIYYRTLWFILTKKGFKAFYNFLYIKCFTIAGGEGTGNWLGDIFYPILYLFPKIKPYIYREPFVLEIEITNKCNKRCIMCEHTYWTESSKDLTFEDFELLIRQIPKLKWVNLTGMGDAFLNKNYMKMIKFLKERNIAVFLVDSFDFITEEKARELVELGVDGIWTSFDACNPDTYNKLKEGCDFERSISNLKTILRIKEELNSPVPEICFRYIINTLNLNEMSGFVELVASLGGKATLGKGSRIEFAGLLAFKEIADYFVPEVPIELIKKTEEAARKNNIEISFAHPKHSSMLPVAERCAAWTEPYILMGGYVMPCCAVLMSNKRDFLRKYSFGNINEKSFDEIWNSDRYKEFRKMIVDPNSQVPILCAGCRAYNTIDREKKYGISKDI